MTGRTAHVSSLETIVPDKRIGTGDTGRLSDTASEAIARAAVELVRPGSAIGISAGPASCAFARLVTSVRGLTVVTNSPRVADILHFAPFAAEMRRTVILTGGVRTASDALAGPVATQAIRNLYMDCVFIGAHGIDAAAGFTSADLPEAETNRAFVAHAKQLVVLADHRAWGVVGRAEFARLHDADVVVSNQVIDGPRKILQDSIDTLILATDG